MSEKMNQKLHTIYKRFPAAFPLPFILDGATGTNLMKAGLADGESTELFVKAHPETIATLHGAYFENGSDGVMCPTFGANAAVMKRHGVSCPVCELNHALVAAAHKNKGDGRYFAGDMSPTGLLMEPYGDASFDDIADIYREQAKALEGAGVDFFEIETCVSLAEARAAVIAVREVSDKPIFVTLTLENGGRTMSGDAVIPSMISLAELGVCAFGANCSTGPDKMLEALECGASVAAALGIPLIAKPNAGMPGADAVGADVFGSFAEKFYEAGIYILGGCCGTDADYIAKIREARDRFCEGGVIHDLPADEDGLADLLNGDPDAFAKIACTNRIAVNTADFEPRWITADEDFADNAAEMEDDGEEVLFVELPADGADYVIENLMFMQLPLAVRGDADEIAKLKRVYNGKLAVYTE